MRKLLFVTFFSMMCTLSYIADAQVITIENELQLPLELIVRTYCTDNSGRARDTIYTITESREPQTFNLNDWWNAESSKIKKTSCFNKQPSATAFSIIKPLCPTIIENPNAQDCIDLQPTPFFYIIDSGTYRVRLDHTGKALEVVAVQYPGVFSLSKEPTESIPQIYLRYNQGQTP